MIPEVNEIVELEESILIMNQIAKLENRIKMGGDFFFSGTSSWKFRSFFFLLKLWKNRLSWRTSRKNMDLYRFIYITMDFDAAPWRQYSYPF